jgi:SAM-dependent methyltransferase
MIAPVMTALFIISLLLFLIYQHRRFLTEREKRVLTNKEHEGILGSINKAAIRHHEDQTVKRFGLNDEQFYLKYYSPVGFLFWKMRFAEALSFATESGDALALDVGGGDGNLTLYARKIGFMSICLDISEPKLRNGREKFRNRGMYLDGVVADATHLPFKQEAFFSAYCLDVLPHIPNEGECVEEMYRVLSRGGKVVANTPCATSMRILNLFEFMYKIRAIMTRSSLGKERILCSNHGSLKNKVDLTVKEAPYLLHTEFTPYELENEFKDLGFTITHLHTWHNLIVDSLANWVHRVTRSLDLTRVTAVCLNRLVSALPYVRYLGNRILIVCTK